MRCLAPLVKARGFGMTRNETEIKVRRYSTFGTYMWRSDPPEK